MKREKIVRLFSGLCCSVCKCDFEKDSLFIKREDKNLLVIQVVCQNCGKSFGLALLGANGFEIKETDSPFVIQDCPEPITYDDVIDAHKFIDKLEKDWSKYIPDELKNI